MLKYLLLLLLFGLLFPLPAYQQAPFVRCGDSASSTPLDCTLKNMIDVPVRIYNFLLGFAAIILLLVIAWAGLRMIVFHLSDMPESELANAKMTLTRGIFGFLIIAMSYLIVNLLLAIFCLNPDSFLFKWVDYYRLAGGIFGCK